MATDKQITNHQLGIALASLIEKQERNQKNVLLEQAKMMEQLNHTMTHLASTYDKFNNLKVNIDTSELEYLNTSIKTTSKEASNRIDSSIKKIIISPYILGIFGLLTFLAVASIWFSLSKVIDLNNQVNETKTYTDHLSEYYKSHPKEWERVKQWNK